MAKENSTILPDPFSNLRDINFGIVLLSIYILFDFAAIQGLFEFVLKYRLSFILAALSVIYALYLVVAKQVDFKSNTTKIFIILCLFIIVYSNLTTKNPKGARANTTLFLQYLANYLIMVSCVKKPSQFIFLIDIFLASIIFSSYHTIMQGGKLYDSIWLKDENHISIIAAYAIPFALILFMIYKSRLKKVCYGIAIAFYVSVVVVAASRGGAVAMFSVGFLCWLLYGHKLRNLLVILIATGLVFSFAPEKFFSEMDTLKQGTEEATAGDRIYLWDIAIKIFREYPILGVGPFNYGFYVPDYDMERRYFDSYLDKGYSRVAHSTPLQWLAEMGIIGSIILILLQIAMYNNWRVVYHYKKSTSGMIMQDHDFDVFKGINHACGISQVGFWVSATFLTLTPYPFYWILVPFSEAWKNVFLAWEKAAPDSKPL